MKLLRDLAPMFQGLGIGLLISQSIKIHNLNNIIPMLILITIGLIAFIARK
jgi:hypothetical protein